MDIWMKFVDLFFSLENKLVSMAHIHFITHSAT